MDTTLRRLLAAIGEPLVQVAAAPGGLDVPLTGLAIVDPDDEPDQYPGQLVLVIGVRGRAATATLRAVARRGAAAVAVKADGAQEALQAAAADAGIALLLVPPEVRWERIESLARDVLHEGGAAGDDGSGDLYSLAQTVALLTRGVVSIEDTASRVLAYSRSDDDAAQVDELRRLSILGRQGPEAYLRMLREWGVFDRLRDSEEVVEVDEHAELGIRRRLAIGIHAGHRQLGTIWVQEGAEPFAERAAEVLVGAARVAAGHIVRRRTQQAPGRRWERDLVAGLLDGRASPDLVAGAVGLNEESSALVVAFAVRDDDAAAQELVVTELVDVVSVHAAAHRRTALCAAVGPRVYAVLPDVHSTDGAVALCKEVVAVTRRRGDVRVQAGIGSPAARLAGVPDSRREADRVLDAMSPAQDVAVFGEIRAEVLLTQTLGLLAANPDLRDPGVARLVEYDREHRTDLVGSVVAWLDAMGDVRAAAERLTVHPNTLRYRVRRASAIAGLRLDDPRARLVYHLQLLAATRST
ncbi:MAG TPA: helix-turn-helix domain-containing protein [Pseudonocardia sp.]|mgnify:CR=1 FL=1|jgi:DNA-binding PucR family transcriptional regulator|uniref:PucR family transcriptional regulator n=1 Tax=Pseudonocardia sp. TaxID=60912 RepID=UPI002B4AC901|nr:helix-turn-helix domain-containing protein [Pseudonocardia sp.]HLU55443.1 helix-turn-helix domain-containing protein [Pseudonocardia sp.]